MSQSSEVVDAFHKLCYDSRAWENTRWDGVPTGKLPSDLLTLNEILWEKQPDLVIETGTWFGGSALYMAQVLDRIGHGYVISIDITYEPCRPKHDRIEYYCGSSVDPKTIEDVWERAHKPRVMVILDSDHSRDHVLSELQVYALMVTSGQYLIVEDTNVSDVLPQYGAGPMEALHCFMALCGGDKVFDVDRSREKKHLFTFNPGGYLVRK